MLDVLSLRMVDRYSVFAVLLSGLFSGQPSWLDEYSIALGAQKYHYAIIIDAGSSGTRINAYKFKEQSKLFSAQKLELEDEFFYETDNYGQNCLAAFVNDPAKGANLVIKLINKTKNWIPKEQCRDTLLVVRATAGLRLLPEHQSRMLLQHVNDSVQMLGYRMRNDSVSIMDSAEEGIFGWYTVNLLLPPMRTGTIASLDLGGGSVEITYALDEFDATLFPSQYQYTVPIESKNVTLFSHSYLNLGLMAARRGILQLEANDYNATEFESACVDPIVQNEFWSYRGINYTISGAYRDQGVTRAEAFNHCRKLVQQYVLRNMDWEPPFAIHGAISAMGYFHEVAADSGIADVEGYSNGTVHDYHRKALSACSSSNIDQPWECLNLVYVISLLKDGFKIPEKKTIMLLRNINGHDVSWGLGLAYNAVMKNLLQEYVPLVAK